MCNISGNAKKILLNQIVKPTTFQLIIPLFTSTGVIESQGDLNCRESSILSTIMAVGFSFFESWSVCENYNSRSMAVVIETSVWEPNSSLFIFIFVCCILSICLFPYAAKNTSPSPFQQATAPSFLRFRRNFLVIFSLASGQLLNICFGARIVVLICCR